MPKLALFSTALLLLVACGDDGRIVTDTGTGTDGGSDSTGTDTTGTDTTGTDTPGTDTPGTDTPGTDGGTVTCFPLSVPTIDLPDAIPGTMDGSTPTWMRPIGGSCPATELGTQAVPFQTVCYENDTAAPLLMNFEMLVGETDLTPAVVIYDGEMVPTDATQCAALSEDLVIDSAEAAYMVPAGGKVTFVATTQAVEEGDFQFVIGPVVPE